jgi:hypothetical protein
MGGNEKRSQPVRRGWCTVENMSEVAPQTKAERTAYYALLDALVGGDLDEIKKAAKHAKDAASVASTKQITSN